VHINRRTIVKKDWKLKKADYIRRDY